MKVLAILALFYFSNISAISLADAIAIVEKESLTCYIPLQTYEATDACNIPCVEIQIDASNPKCKGNTILLMRHNDKYSLVDKEYSFDGISVYKICGYPTGLFEYYFFNQGCQDVELGLGSFNVKR